MCFNIAYAPSHCGTAPLRYRPVRAIVSREFPGLVVHKLPRGFDFAGDCRVSLACGVAIVVDIATIRDACEVARVLAEEASKIKHSWDEIVDFTKMPEWVYGVRRKAIEKCIARGLLWEPLLGVG
ncbi:MAG: hypothetical protein H0Z39_07185 [Peptococcaceae bacterium]|nr:hypothetical protein [Peptococcaceae bacterium]